MFRGPIPRGREGTVRKVAFERVATIDQNLALVLGDGKSLECVAGDFRERCRPGNTFITSGDLSDREDWLFVGDFFHVEGRAEVRAVVTQSSAPRPNARGGGFVEEFDGHERMICFLKLFIRFAAASLFAARAFAADK